MIIKLWNNINYNTAQMDVREYDDGTLDYKFSNTTQWSDKSYVSELDQNFIKLLHITSPDISFIRSCKCNSLYPNWYGHSKGCLKWKEKFI